MGSTRIDDLARSYVDLYSDRASRGSVGGTVKLSRRQRGVQVARTVEAASRLRVPGLLVLNDPVGTGKTLIALAAARLLMESGADAKRVRRVLVVAPNAEVKKIWEQRAEWVGLRTEDRGAPLIVRTQSELERARKSGLPRDPAQLLLIVDEAHRGLHNPRNAAHRRLLPVALGARVLLVTATPFQLSASGLETMLEVDGNGIRGDRIRDYGAAVARWLQVKHESDIGDGSREELAQAQDEVAEKLALAQRDLNKVLMPRYPYEKMGRSARAIVPDPKVRQTVPLRDWASTYHAARIIPDLLGDLCTEPPAARNSDTYMRMLVSSTGAWKASAAYRAALKVGGPLAGLLDTLDARMARHPKVAATAGEVVDRLRRGHHVLVFCVFTATQQDLAKAIRRLCQDVPARVEAPGGVNAAQLVVRNGFGREPTVGESPIALVVRDNLSESIDLDGGRPVVVHHDLSWSPVRWEQRMGRVIRASTGFQEPPEVIVPVLDTPVDERMWRTLRGRAELTTFVTSAERQHWLEESLRDDDPADPPHS